jgi:hypothetical protein
MPAPSWEDLDDFLDEDDFAFPAVIHLQSGGQIPLSVIFDSRYVEADTRDAYVADQAMPVATCKSSLVQAVRRGDTITVTFPYGAVTFDIMTAPQGNGTGISEIAMARQ